MKYPIGIQTFANIRQEGYLYVDKTALVYQLAIAGKYYFLSRPRRFGKSLLITTLEAYFQGRRELFRGLAMEKLEHNWTVYPVLHIDFNARDYSNPDALRAELNKHLEYWEKVYGNEYQDREPEERFQHIIGNIVEKTGKPVVILVDEYDKPLL
ncbi:MAG: AAA family ATPase, partial [Bacteroidetes bacterium]|nr:AAA family ATPase [Bacteroidota bacterium]